MDLIAEEVTAHNSPAPLRKFVLFPNSGGIRGFLFCPLKQLYFDGDLYDSIKFSAGLADARGERPNVDIPLDVKMFALLVII